jgi:Leu/Phe-tRNA-protein transferase
MHKEGYAMSVETWYDNHLVGGLYGVILGSVFFGESMFSLQSDASKVALVHLANHSPHHISLIDCQMETDHIISMGAELISRKTFLDYLKNWA